MKFIENLKKNPKMGFLLMCGLILLLFAIKEGSPLYPYMISGESMDPTLKDKQIALIDQYAKAKELKYGDIIVFKPNFFTFYVKRVIATPGDTVVVEDGKIRLNGAWLDEDRYSSELIENPGILSEPYTVGPKELICIGDNRNYSYDSRDFGAVPFKQVKGRVLFASDHLFFGYKGVK